jgi:hypothetical protein
VFTEKNSFKVVPKGKKRRDSHMRIAVVTIFGADQRYALHISASPGSAGILDQDIDF